MIGLPAGTRIWLAAGATDMRKGFDGLSALVQTALRDDPFSGQLFVFRGRRGDRVSSFGVMEPAGFRHIGASRFSAYWRQ